MCCGICNLHRCNIYVEIKFMTTVAQRTGEKKMEVYCCNGFILYMKCVILFEGTSDKFDLCMFIYLLIFFSDIG